MRGLPRLIPHRPGCADFPLPVLHGRASLAVVSMTLSVTHPAKKAAKVGIPLRCVPASTAIRCRFVDRFVRLKVLSHVSRQRFSPHGTPLSSIGALSRGFGTCCLRFKNGVATTHAKLASGWLARLYREGVEPSGSLQKVSDHPSSFSGLGLAQGKFHVVLSLSGISKGDPARSEPGVVAAYFSLRFNDRPRPPMMPASLRFN